MALTLLDLFAMEQYGALPAHDPSSLKNRQRSLNQKIFEKISGFHEAMLTTIGPDGYARSRPMIARQIEPGKIDEGEKPKLWFFTHERCQKVSEIETNPKVNASFVDPEERLYVSVSGDARLSHDRPIMEALWSPLYKTWFPEGLQDPHIALIEITVDRAEYWDTISKSLISLANPLEMRQAS